jgi:DNA-damage-inducible protein J
MAATTIVHVRVDEKVKQRAAKALAAMGMSVSDVVRILLVRVAAEKAVPFELRIPNRKTKAAMEAGERGEVTRATSLGAMKARLDAND